MASKKLQILLAKAEAEVCIQHWGVSTWLGAEVFTKRRGQIHVTLRRRLARHLRELGFSFKVIGAALGRDHASIIYLLRGKNGIKKAELSGQDSHGGREGDDQRGEALC